MSVENNAFFGMPFHKVLTAARENNTEAMEQLAQLYLHGEGTAADPAEALRWQKKLTEHLEQAYTFSTENRHRTSSKYFFALQDLCTIAGKAKAPAEQLSAAQKMLQLGRREADAYMQHHAHSWLGHLALDSRDTETARTHFEKELALTEEMAASGEGYDVRALSVCCSNMADLRRAEGEPKAARIWLEKGLALDEKLAKESDAAYAKRALAFSYNELANLCRRLGDSEAAKGYCRKAVSLLETLTAVPEGRDLRKLQAELMDMLGTLFMDADRGAALANCEKALRLRQELLAEAPSLPAQRDVACSYDSLGRLRRATGDNEGALTYYKKAAEIFETLLEATGSAGAMWDLALNCDRQAYICADREDAAGARALCEKALSLRESLYAQTGANTDREQLIDDLERLERICLAMGDAAAAENYAARAKALRG